MAQMSAGDLRSRVTVLRRAKKINELNETTYDYEPERKVWARIVPTTGRKESIEGEVDRVEVTHRVTMRRSSIPELNTDLRLRFRDQDYQVQYFYPNYRDSGFLDIFVKLVVERNVRGF